MIRKLVMVLFSLAAGIAFASPQLVMSQQDPAVLKAYISQLREMRNSGKFSAAEREQLDELWRTAADIEVMNDRCGTISITEEIDESCENFYQYELPKFETQYFKLTGEIRLSPNRLSNAIEQRRQAINQCYEALQVDAFYPTRYFTLEGSYTPEPLSKGVEVSYNFSLEENRGAINDLNDRIRQWYNACGKIIHHSDNSGALAPIFVELVRQSRANASKANGGLYFELEQGYGKRLLVKTKDGIEGVYYLNGRELFNYKIQSSRVVFSINLDGRRSSADLVQGDHWRDRVIFDDSDLRDGLMGRFVWGKPRNPWLDTKQPSTSSPAAEYKSYDDGWENHNSTSSVQTSSTPSSFGIYLQALGGINLTFGEASEAEPFKDFETENDSVTAITGYAVGLLVFEFTRQFAIGLGGGISWNNVTYEHCNGHFDTSCDEENIHQAAAPMATAEINIGEGLNGGVRFSYIFDKDMPTTYLAGFAELGNVLGIELGWAHADGLWDNIYMGLSLRLPPRHLSDLLKETGSKKK